MLYQKIKFTLVFGLLLCYVILNAQPVFSYSEPIAVSESELSSRILYLNDSWNDLPARLANPPSFDSYGPYPFMEIRRIEVENDTIIVCANATLEGEGDGGTRAQGSPANPQYFLYFDTNLDNKTDICWGYNARQSLLYNFTSKEFYFNGSWQYASSSTAGNFTGAVKQNNMTGETAVNLAGVIQGAVKIKAISIVRTILDTPIKYMGDLVPGLNSKDMAKLGNWPAYDSRYPPNDTAFPYPYNNVTLEHEAPETPPEPPPEPPPPPEEVRPNFFVQMAVWAMNATVWVRNEIVNLPFWMRDNAVSGSLIVMVLALSSYSIVKKWLIGKQRLKKLQADS